MPILWSQYNLLFHIFRIISVTVQGLAGLEKTDGVD